MRIVVLVSGSGTNLQAVIDAVSAGSLPVEIAAVGSDVPGCGGLERAERAGIPTFAVPLARGGDRAAWNSRLRDEVRGFSPALVVSSGFMRILGAEFLDGVGVPIINTHPALLPSFPGAHAVRDAVEHGVKITGCTVHQVDAGVDTGPILAQEAVRVLPDDDVDTLHERIKVEERRLLVETIAGIADGRIGLPSS
ncbi:MULTISPECIES: phosphoribosylglycinamide formyltransferase [unclassified Nesterenkonia]|uniref:phosphoribosylglycinamide formyltransferase n=1 Tax=unclassified Nesterenkonia TaxID=2629769 RepID=UPI000872DF5A|nr:MULTISPECIES: phosphoribosylglycinamide formyltransferase [unclassified Nesterenkonia]MDS2172258.1 phosphoribosylglycinamide formyltransferase [Nesterenkonia sp. CL21]OSM44590.1 phosphoribosylglycinamide formyltransferase [Nesterenkonia sp. PF2B19]